MSQPSICLICAYREHCVKQSRRGVVVCPEFTKDLRIKEDVKEEKSSEGEVIEND